jgi:hypothetical protein
MGYSGRGDNELTTTQVDLAAYRSRNELTLLDYFGQKLFEILLNTRPARRRRLTLDYLVSLRPCERLAWR